MLQIRWFRKSILRTATIILPTFTLLWVLWKNPNWTDRSVHDVLTVEPSNMRLGSNEANSALCRRQNWKPFNAKNRQFPRRVYDLLMVNTELEWLEIRLSTTYDYVDYFIVVESPKTFTNHDKPLIVKDHLDKLAAYRDKIIYHELVIPEGFHSERDNPAWAWEDLQRNAMYEQVLILLNGTQAPIEGDVILVSDVDEILRPETLAILQACEFPPRLNLRTSFYYYSFQFRHKTVEWPHPQATYFRRSKTIIPVNLRNSDGGFQPLIRLDTATLWNAGWHCSSCFSTLEELLTKLSSFSHQWMNADEFRNRDRIVEYFRQGKDLWDRKNEDFERIEENHDIPMILLDQRERFAYLLSRDGPSAGFRDYP